ncbi:MAG: homocysteine S-methyltransferase, partial [Chloroflexota bacterium]
YTGNYGLNQGELTAWHRERWHLLASSGADLLACETIPSFPEALAYLDLLSETPETAVWFSFSCRNGAEISDGTPVEEVVTAVAAHPQVVAIGVNCTAPRYIPDLIKTMHQLTKKPIVVYPNSGEAYDAERKEWHGESIPAEFGTFSKEWRKMGAAIIGGCCRTTPAHIRQIRDRFR